ncbi:MAG TPA: PEP-CTERM sorting domain-containing protein [Verrucomicrobiae bacterium]|nr:PEP-CTERM sorting domain-containing protein [Verrucomicrobiae bacterium]
MKTGNMCVVARVACLGLALALLSPSWALAVTNVFQFNYTFSSGGSLSSPTGPAPWLTANIQDVTLGTVDLTINASGLQGSEYVSSFFMNLDPAMNPTSLSFLKTGMTGSFTDPTINLGENGYKADGDGYYDIDLEFSTSHGSTFTVGDSITYQITGSGLDANDFEFTSQMGGGTGTYLAAAHVQSIGADGSSSAWIAPVPEPASAALLLFAAGLWFGARRLVKRTH